MFFKTGEYSSQAKIDFVAFTLELIKLDSRLLQDLWKSRIADFHFYAFLFPAKINIPFVGFVAFASLWIERFRSNGPGKILGLTPPSKNR